MGHVIQGCQAGWGAAESAARGVLVRATRLQTAVGGAFCGDAGSIARRNAVGFPAHPLFRQCTTTSSGMPLISSATPGVHNPPADA